MPNITVSTILDYASKSGASDIHITEGKYITFRIDGVLNTIKNIGIINHIKTKQILLELLNENKENIKNFLNERDLDFAYIYSDGTSFRINAFFKLGKISFVLRRISNKIKEMNQLGLPPAVDIFTKLKQGLILITGPTGSGKSTTMVSILEKINTQRGEHILTIEDPIEFVFTDNKSIFSQREVGRDTKSFQTALKSAMREDPNIIMVGELRDYETVKAAIELSETGHLVISTLHTSSAVQTINRILSFYPIDSQNSIREKLSEILKGVLSQRLVPKINGGRIGIFELMLINSGIKNLIRTGTINQIQGNIETSMKEGMITMKHYGDILYKKGFIEKKSYVNFFNKDAG